MPQPLELSDRRVVLLFLVGLVLLAAIGVVGSALVTDPCSGLIRTASTRAFVRVDPAQVLSRDAPTADAEALFAYGTGAGLGPWRGAIQVGDDTEVAGTAEGFLVFEATGIHAVEPGLSAIKANRGTAGERVLRAFNGAAIVDVDPNHPPGGDATGETADVAVLDEDLSLLGCGRVGTDRTPLAIDRVRALYADGSLLEAVGLDDVEQDWERRFDHDVERVDLLLAAALVVTAGDVHLVDLVDGSSFRSWPLDGVTVHAVGEHHALVATPRRQAILDLTDGGVTDVAFEDGEAVALLDGQLLASGGLPALPAPVEAVGLTTSGHGYTALRVDVDGATWLLLHGPASPVARSDGP